MNPSRSASVGSWRKNFFSSSEIMYPLSSPSHFLCLGENGCVAAVAWPALASQAATSSAITLPAPTPVRIGRIGSRLLTLAHLLQDAGKARPGGLRFFFQPGPHRQRSAGKHAQPPLPLRSEA